MLESLEQQSGAKPTSLTECVQPRTFSTVLDRRTGLRADAVDCPCGGNSSCSDASIASYSCQLSCVAGMSNSGGGSASSDATSTASCTVGRSAMSEQPSVVEPRDAGCALRLVQSPVFREPQVGSSQSLIVGSASSEHGPPHSLLQMALVLLVYALPVPPLPLLSEKEERIVRRAMKGRGSPVTGVAVSTQMFVILLLLLQLLKGASAVCSKTVNGVTATVDASGNLVIPKEWTSVPNYAFYAYSSYNPDCRTTLKYVTFEEPSKVTRIGYQAFREDTSLVSIFLPSSLTSMSYSVFYDSGGPLVIFNCAGPAVSFNSDAFRYSGINTIYVPAGSSGADSVNMQTTLACCPAGKYSSTGGNQAGCTSGACTSGCTGECPAGKYST